MTQTRSEVALASLGEIQVVALVRAVELAALQELHARPIC